MTRDEILALPVVVPVPVAGQCYGLGREASYAHARAGTFPVPVLRLGRALRVRTAHLIDDLCPAGQDEGRLAGRPVVPAGDPSTAPADES